VPVQVNPFLSYDSPYPDKTLVLAGEAFQNMLNFLDCSPVVVFDHETSGLEWFRDSSSCGIALAGFDKHTGKSHSYYVPYRHRTGEPQLDLAVIGPAFKKILADERTKIGHNLKFDEHFSRREGWRVCGPRYDTMIAARLFDENRPLALKTRAEQDLGRTDADEWESKVGLELLKLSKLHRMGKDDYRSKYGYCQVAIPILGIYACLDVEFTLQLYTHYERAGISGVYPRIWKTEMRVIEALTDLEEMGLPIDVPYLERLRVLLGQVKVDLEAQIFQHVGRMFNPGSDDELRDFLINSLGLKLTKLTDSKANLSVDNEVLESFEAHHPTIPLIMKWKDAEKLSNTYTTSILDRLDNRNVLHPSFNQAGTNTGRMSCKEPNFQNMPTDDDKRAEAYSGCDLEHGGIDPWSIRRAFVNRGPGWVRLFFDYSQVELRVLAFYSKDPIMVDNYLKGGDIHSRTSEEVFGSKEKKHRRISKVINFGLSYGLTDLGLSRQAKIPMDEAEKFMATFFQRYAGVAAFRRKFWAHVRAQGCRFQNLFGRPRRVPHIVSPSDYHRGRGERQAIATLIQGTAAEITKEALVRVHDRFQREGLPAYLVNVVHDDIQVDTHVDALVSVASAMKEEMERFPEFAPIPITVDGEYTTQSWADKRGLPL
jgi:DNA polymerase I